MALLLRSDWHLNPDVPETGSLPERILAGRGMLSPEAVSEFLHPAIDRLHDPFLLPDMDKACSLIIQAMNNGRQIVIYGDYDADGITAAALLIRFFRGLDTECRWLIPDRMTDGYGLTEAGAEKVLENGAQLLITVDCGIASLDEISRLNSAGVKVIVTDHHECRSELPDAAAIINPKRPDNSYPFPGLAGVGVALKLTQALCRRLGLGNAWQAGLELAALGTVADVVPLTGENRMIVGEGLKFFPKRRNPGITALLDAVGQSGRPVTSQTLGYTLAPRINAAGRLGSAASALDLLLTNDPAIAAQGAAALVELNRQRQELESAITAEAIQEIDKSFDFSSRCLPIVAKEGWHQGVIGIVASRLTDYYSRPVIVLTGEDGYYRGSGRSTGDFNLLAAIEHAADHTVKFGGHRKAAGIVVAAGQLEDFRQSVNEYAHQYLPAEYTRPVIEADLETAADELTLENALSLRQMEPFGEDNPQPLLICRRMILKTIRQTGNGRHLKLQLASSQSRKLFEGIAFGRPEAEELFSAGDPVDVLFALEVNTWQGSTAVQLNIRDLALSRSNDEFTDAPWIADSLYRGKTDLKSLMRHYGLPLKTFRPDREEYKRVYQFIRSRFGGSPVLVDLTLLARCIARSYQTDLNMFRLSRILAVFQDIGLVSLRSVDEDRIRLAMLPAAAKVSLEESPSFCRLEAEGVDG